MRVPCQGVLEWTVALLRSSTITGSRPLKSSTGCPITQHVLQSYVWQHLDLAPRFPNLTKFLDFWERNLDGKLHRVRVANAALIKPAEFRFASGLYELHWLH